MTFAPLIDGGRGEMPCSLADLASALSYEGIGPLSPDLLIRQNE